MTTLLLSGRPWQPFVWQTLFDIRLPLSDLTESLVSWIWPEKGSASPVSVSLSPPKFHQSFPNLVEGSSAQILDCEALLANQRFIRGSSEAKACPIFACDALLRWSLPSASL
ncbi:hypothetical protein Acr_28g0003240 [Actinidia rufa]|uniref:Uncharacterized protein n=1 Tax=Actinidia rufa TaxID=165716 RepID=A0A7J0H976_9ERIC|nr:hypothetical protein Acr_28g0003240 [Actinidia rufa]